MPQTGSAGRIVKKSCPAAGRIDTALKISAEDYFVFDVDNEKLSAGKLVQQKCVKKTGSVKVSTDGRFVFDIDDEELRKMKEETCPPKQ